MAWDLKPLMQAVDEITEEMNVEDGEYVDEEDS